MRVKRILIPVDFSTCSVNAMQYTGHLARKFNAKVMFLNVAEGATALSKTAFKEYKQEKLEEIEKLIETVPSLTNSITEAKVDWHDLKDAVFDTVDSFQIDLVVMGTRGAYGLFRELACTNTYDIVKDCKIPVLVIPETNTYSEPKKLGFASDFKEIDHLVVLDILLDFAYAFKAELHIFHILVKGEKELDEEYFNMKELEDYFSAITHKFHEVNDDDLAKGINNFVKSNAIDMLAIMPRKHSMFKDIIKRQTTEEVTEHAKLPILAIHE